METTIATEFVGGTPTIAVDVIGGGPAVIFLHGLGGNRSNWQDQLPVFAGKFRALAWDARGYGASGDYDGPYDFGDVCDDLIRVLDHFNIERSHIVGLSMGGRIALEMSGRYPDRIASIVFASTSARPGEGPTPAQRDEALRLRRKPFEDGLGARAMAENLAATLMSDNASPEMRARVIESCASVHPECYLKSVETVVTYSGYPPYETVAAPTLVITGTEDKLAPPSFAEQIASKVPNSKLVILEGAGHLSNIEQPAEFNAAVMDFLAKQVV